MDELSKRIAALSPAKRTILKQRLQEISSANGAAKDVFTPDRTEDLTHDLRRLGGMAAPPLRPVAREQPLPLSFAQERLWIVDQMFPGSPAYNAQLLVRLEGPLSLPALGSAIERLVHRHEALRTRFPVINGEPAQEILPVAKPELKVIDLSGDAPNREDEALQLAQAEGSQLFDLAKGPLVRWLLIRLDSSLHFLRIGMHHIISDGWSQEVIYRELAEFYGSAAEGGRATTFEELPIQYADFSSWQRRWLSGNVLQKQLDYWKSQLAGISRMDFPADRPPAAKPSFCGRSEQIFIGRDTVAAIKRLAIDESATLFMALLAAFQTLLQRYSGHDDIAVGTPIANRNRIETEGVVGFFVNSLVLRTDLSGDPTFREALRRVREITLKAYEFQDAPFEKLVEELAPERDFGQNAFFQIMFALQNLPPRRPIEVAGLKMSQIPSRPTTTRFEIEVHLWEALGGLEGQLIYDPDRFDTARILRMIEHYRRIVQTVSTEPDRKLSTLPMLSSEERECLLFEWNQTATPYPRERCIREQFEEPAPRNAIEQQLAAIWRRLLNIEVIGVYDNFFQIGGHSLLALRLIHDVNERFSLQLPIRPLFADPTIAGLARKIHDALVENGDASPYPPLVLLRPGGSRKPFFLVAGGFGGDAELLVYAKLARHLAEELPVYGLRARGVDELVEPHETVETMAEEHLASIRKVQPRGPYFIGGSCVGGVVALEIAQQLCAAGEEVARLILVDSQYPSRSGLVRYRFRVWRDQLRPAINNCRERPGDFFKLVNEQLRMWFAPSEEQKIGQKKVRIGRKYLRRFLRYSPRSYAGPVTMIICEDSANRDACRVWRDVALGGLRVHMVPGDHISHLREHAEATAAVLESALGFEQPGAPQMTQMDAD